MSDRAILLQQVLAWSNSLMAVRSLDQFCSILGTNSGAWPPAKANSPTRDPGCDSSTVLPGSRRDTARCMLPGQGLTTLPITDC